MRDTATRFAFFLVRPSTVTVPLVPRPRPTEVSAAPQPNRVLDPKPRLALNVSIIAQHAPPISSYLISFIVVLWNKHILYPSPLLPLVSSISSAYFLLLIVARHNLLHTSMILLIT